jgi:chemotaxis response regulator CheB
VNPVRVLVVDDQEVFRRVMSAVVQRTDGFVLAGCAASGEESIVTAGVLRPRSGSDGRRGRGKQTETP